MTTEPWTYINNSDAPNVGKWLLFYAQFDEDKWEMARRVASELGINAKCSAPNARSSDFVLAFSASEELGLRLRAMMTYRNKMYYKTHEQEGVQTHSLVIFPRFDRVFRRSDVRHITAVGFRFRGAAPTDLVGADASFVAEPTNAYDPNAVKILIGARHVAYVSREDTHLVRAGVSKIVEAKPHDQSARCAIVDL